MRMATAVLVLLTVSAAFGGEPPKPNPETVVLDLDRGSFRAFLGWKTPVLISPDGKVKKPVPVRVSDRPAANWAAVDFDDSGWPRVGGLVAANLNGADGDLVCLRGKFNVIDPAKVSDLKLTASYFGGAVVHVNGVELQRGHLPALSASNGPEGKLEPDTLAIRYPDDAYVTPGNKFRGPVDTRYPQNVSAYLQGRQRDLPSKGLTNGVSIPSSMLRKGVNVVAIEVRAAPLNELAVEKTVGSASWSGTRCHWAHAMAVSARLSSSSGPDAIGATAPIQGIEFSNSQPAETVDACNRMLPSERIFPIRLVGARNGVFSGKVVLSSAGAIRNLKVVGPELVQAGGQGRIPAAAVQVRWAERVTPQVSCAADWDPLMFTSFDRLRSEFPAETPVAKLLGDRRQLAVVPVWVTVRVPADAAAGEYEGTITIEAEGTGPVKFPVPVHLKVNDWKLPDPRDFVTHNDIYQSPDSVAEYYKVPRWSDKHFELIGKSLKAFQEVGNKLCIVNLTVDSRSLGNTESMVRWVRKGGSGSGVQGSGAGNPGAAAGKPEPGTPNPEPFTYDFTIAEKYMDLYEKTCGKPAILRIEAWQRANDPKNAPTLCVSVLDPATGKVEPMAQPPYGTAENEAFWRPVFTELRKRLEKRGWYDVTAVGWINYQHGPGQVNAGIVDVYKHLWPDGKWMQTTHMNPSEYPGAVKGVVMPIAYSEYVWGAGALYNPDAGGQYPRAWKSGAARIELGFPRYGVQFINAISDGSPLSAYRFVTEAALQGNLRGLGYLGGDFWPVRKAKPSDPNDLRYRPISYSFCGIGMSDAITCCFSPGPDGTVFNGRMEMFREGVQVCEAIIFLQRALEDKKAAGALAQKINDLLDERARHYCKTRGNNDNWLLLESSNWQERDDRLFALCAEVAAKTGTK